jgi:glycosyltransferase involved in cell wall biosynthesis
VTRVLLDCTAIPVNRAGVARYLEGLIAGLNNIGGVDLHLAVQERDADSLQALAPDATVHAVPARFTGRGLRLLWEQFGLPRLARSAGADVVHSPHYTFPVLRHGARVVTVHDATFFSDPEVHGTVKRYFFRFWIRAAWRSRGSVIADSHATAAEVERFVGPAQASVSVAHLGVDLERFRPPAPDAVAAFRDAHALTGDWFAFLGTIEPRKNLGALLDAYESVRATLGDAAPPLLISGGRGWDTEALARLDALTPDSGVHVLGYLPLEELPALLGGAVAVMYPSFGEGFGLPVLEAMACGAMVITTDKLAIPEVGGEAVEYAGTDAPSIAAAMLAALATPARREELSTLAIARAATFSWDATARAHVEAYTAAHVGSHD